MVKIFGDDGNKVVDTELDSELKAAKREKRKISKKIRNISKKKCEGISKSILDKVNKENNN